jgi:hypothetical protein
MQNILFYRNGNAFLKKQIYINRIFAIEFDYRPQAYVVLLCDDFCLALSIDAMWSWFYCLPNRLW